MVLVLMLVCGLEACTGYVYETTTPGGWEKGDSYVQAYRMAPFIVRREFTAVVTDSKGTLGYECKPTPAYDEIVAMPDYARPVYIVHHHGYLETNQFAVQMASDGTLTSVSTQGTPPTSAAAQMIPALMTASVAAAALAAPRLPRPACNADPVTRSVVRCEKAYCGGPVMDIPPPAGVGGGANGVQ